MIPRRRFIQSLTASAALSESVFSAQAESTPTRIAILVGPSDHPPGTHEVAAGGRLMKDCLERAENIGNVEVNIFYEWPSDETAFNEATTVVFIGDTFPLQRMPDTEANLRKLDTMMAHGCGIVCVHYATGLLNDDVPDDGEHPLLRWMGGYFATKCDHHQSVAKIHKSATITPEAAEHPVWRGCGEFTLHDEPYTNIYFGKDGDQPERRETSFGVSLLPPEAPKKETVSWGIEREDGGRGFAVVMPHYYRNWMQEDLRRFILNGIVWSAGVGVPGGGVQTVSLDLRSYEPESLEPQPRKPRKKKEKY